jgi:hypothetical protein
MDASLGSSANCVPIVGASLCFRRNGSSAHARKDGTIVKKNLIVMQVHNMPKKLFKVWYFPRAASWWPLQSVVGLTLSSRACALAAASVRSQTPLFMDEHSVEDDAIDNMVVFLKNLIAAADVEAHPTAIVDAALRPGERARTARAL